MCRASVTNTLQKTSNINRVFVRPWQSLPPPNVSESEHPSYGTSLWFLSYCNHVAHSVSLSCLNTCTHVNIWADQLNTSHMQLLKGAAGVSVLSLGCGWHRSDGAESLYWQSVSQSVSQSCYTIPHPVHPLFFFKQRTKLIKNKHCMHKVDRSLKAEKNR